MSEDKKLEDYFASWLIFIGCLAIIFLVGAFVYRSFIDRPHPFKIEISLVEDKSTGDVKEMYSRAQIDSVLTLIKQQELSISKRENFQMEKTEWSKDYQEIIFYGGAFILAIASFFGYKSFREVKSESKEVAKEETIKYLDKNLGDYVKKEILKTYSEENYSTMIGRLKSDLIEEKIFLTSVSLRDKILTILHDWTIDIRSNDSKEEVAISEADVMQDELDESSTPEDFND